MFLFDLETNGLDIEKITKIHCLSLHNMATGISSLHVGDEQVCEALKALSDATHRGVLVDAYNGVGFDYAVCYKLHPDVWDPDPRFLTDSLVKSRLIYSDIYLQVDEKLIQQKRLPNNLGGAHSLESWGYRLGCHKGSFDGPWDTYTDEMGEYCLQDIRVLAKLRDHLDKCSWAAEGSNTMQLEILTKWIVQAQCDHGVFFNVHQAGVLYGWLSNDRESARQKLEEHFGCFYLPGKPFVPKKDSKAHGYTGGVPLSKVKLVEFNPGSS